MNLKSEKRFVCLHASPVVSAGHYGNLVTLPVVRDAFAVKQDIDIVVTGLAKASDEHGQLRQFLLALGGAGQRSLDGKHWIGEVHCLPYDEKGPVERFAPVRAVTLFEIRELRDLARTKGKYVVVVGGTCTGGPTGVCGQDKAEALHPLLTQDALRFPTHVVTERRTAQKLLDA
jgi:DNA-binding transcriptional regulator LsrR (DeoR family)